MKRPLRLSLLTIATTVVALLLPLGSCRDNGPAGPRTPRSVALSLAPSFAVTAAGSAPIIAIRAVARDASTSAVLTSSVTTVDPNATSWPVALTIPLVGSSETVIVSVELLSSTSPVVVEWSGEVGPIEVSAGQTQDVESVTLGRGPLDNLKVTGVTITATPPTIVEGDALTLTATATGAASAEIFWASLDAAVATIDATGKVASLRDGSARMVASAGTQADTITVTVLQRPASVAVAPDSVLLTSVGAQGTLAATVKDPRGAAIAGATVQWSSGDATVAKSLGAGAFQAVANGRTTAIATVTTAPAVSGTGIVRVSQAATQLAINAGQSQTAAAGTAVATPPTVLVTDAGGAPVPGVSVTFTVASGGGSVGGAGATSVVVTTNASGLASTAWKLGSIAGANSLTASVVGATAVTFDATAAPPASSIVIVAGGNQLGTPGQPAPVTPQVKLLDGAGAPAPGVTVTFAVITGNGFLGQAPVTSANVVTDASGIATSPTWLLGGNPATNTLTATVSGLAPVTFVVETIGSIVVASGDGQTGTAGLPLAAPIVAKVLTTAGAPMAGQTVQFVIISGSGGLGGPTTWTTATTVVTDSSGLAAAAWELGFPGPQQAGANVPGAGISGVTFNANASSTPTPTTIQVISGNAQSGTVGSALANPLVVSVLDQNNASLAGASVTFAVTAGGGTLGSGQTSVVVTTDAAGKATSPAWTLGTTAGANSVKVSAGSAPPVTFDATGTAAAPAKLNLISGDAQTGIPGTALANPLVAGVTDAFNNPVPSVTVTWTPSDGSVAPASSATDATGHAQTSFTPGYGSAAQTVTASASGLTSITFHTTVTLPSVGLSLVGVDKVSLGRQASVGVALTQPAPAGGVTVTVTSGTPSVLGVVAPGTAFIPAGQTTGAVTVSGVAEGTSVLTASAPPFLDGTLSASVELRLISMPTTASVPFGQTASIPITLARAAPAGGTVVTLTSRNTGIVGATTSTVTIPAGSTSGNGVLSGVNPGTVYVDATNPLYDPDSVLVTTSAALVFTPTSAGLNTSFGTTGTVQFTSNGIAVPAPAPGVTVTFTAASPACVAVPATATIPTGLTSVSVPLTYGGSATTPCTSQIYATAPSITADTITANVQPAPAVNVTGARIGSGLQRAFSGTLGASNGPATTVTIKSPDATLLAVSPNATTVGTASLDIPLAAGVTSFTFYVQAAPGKTGALTLTATATGFTGDTAQINVVTPAFDVQGVQPSLSSIGADDQFYVRTGVDNGQLTGLNELQAVSVSASAITATATVSDVKIGNMIFGTGATQTAGASASVTIQPGQFNSPTTLATGGFALRGIQNGTVTVTTTLPGFNAITSTTTGGSIPVTVVSPTIALSPATLGAGLQRSMNGTVSNANPAGMTMHVRSSDPTRVLIALNATATPDTAVDIVMGPTATVFSFYVHGLEGQTGAVAIGATTPGYTSASTTITEVQPAFDVQGVPTTMNVGDADRPFYVRVGIPNGQLTGLNELQAIRTGGTPMTASIRVSGTGVTLVQSAGVNPSASVTIGVGQFNSPTSVASGGVAVRALSNGTPSVVTAVSGALATNSTSTGGNITITVNTPATTLGSTTVGSGLMTQVNGSLAAPAPAGGLAVTIVSADSTVAKLAPNATTTASDTIVLNLAANATSFSFYVHGMEGKTGAVAVTTSASGYTSGSGTATIVTPAFDVQGLATSINTLDADQPFYVRVGVPNGQLTGLNALQAVRFGAPAPLTVLLASSNPTVGGLKVGTAGTTQQTAQLSILAGQFNTPTSLASGGVGFDPSTSGTTTINTTIAGFNAITSATTGGAINVTVSPPAFTVTSATVGAGLERVMSVSLGSPAPAGLVVTIKSSQPSVALVSPTATAPGAVSFDTTLAAGTTNFSFYAQGMAGQTGAPTITASASGFNDGTSVVTIVTPAFGLVNVPTSVSQSAASNYFYVRVGIPNAQNTGFNEIQSVRAGGGTLGITVSTSDPSVATLAVVGGATGASVPLQIAEGQSNTPTGSTTTGAVLLDPVAAGTATIAASIGGYISINASTNGGSQLVTVTSPAPPPIGATRIRSGAGAAP